jgi:hypothetical protein
MRYPSRWPRNASDGLQVAQAGKKAIGGDERPRCQTHPIPIASFLSEKLLHHPLKPIPKKPTHGDGLAGIETKAEVEVEVGRRDLDSDPALCEQGFKLLADCVGQTEAPRRPSCDFSAMMG